MVDEPWGPLPNDVVNDSIIVASIVTNDDDPTTKWFLILLLNKVPPYFSVAEIRWPSKSIDWKEDFMNIVPAVEFYEDSGGDY